MLGSKKKIGSPLFEARIQEQTLAKDQDHLLAQSSLKQGLYLGGSKSPRPVTNAVSCFKEGTGGCPRLAASQTGLELKKKKRRGLYWEGGKEMD